MHTSGMIRNQLTASPPSTVLGKRMTGKRLRCAVQFFHFAAAATVGTKDAATSSQQSSLVPQQLARLTPQHLKVQRTEVSGE